MLVGDVNKENIMIAKNNSKSKQVYEVGEYCGIDGRLWSVLVEDNKDALRNIKGVLLKHYQKELDILLGAYQECLGDSDYIMLVKGFVCEYEDLLAKIKSSDSLEQICYIRLEENYRYILVRKVKVIS